jgi:hypothetical protein
MGAWGPASFQNDSALDWYEEFRDEGARAIQRAFEAAQTDDYLEVDEGSAVIAAAEIVAAAFGKPPAEPPEEFDALISDHAEAIRALPDIRSTAVAAVRRVLAEPSELSELWHEDGEDNARQWLGPVNDLIARLN